jgi:tetratricopeptide (TPR) repeat protein
VRGEVARCGKLDGAMSQGPDELEAGWELLRRADGAAVAFFTERLRDDDQDAFAHFGLATALGMAGRDEEAIPHLERALDIGLPPRLYNGARMQLGNSLRLVGRAEEAVAVHRQIAVDHPSSANDLLLALALRDAGRPDEGLATAMRAVLVASQDETIEAFRELFDTVIANLEGTVPPRPRP